jgi:hypothetical protein
MQITGALKWSVQASVSIIQRFQKTGYIIPETEDKRQQVLAWYEEETDGIPTLWGGGGGTKTENISYIFELFSFFPPWQSGTL